jgi:transmembrane protein 33
LSPANYDSAMKVVAYTEIFILARVIIGALMLRNSFVTPIFYAHFIRMRYFQSAFTREAIVSVTVKIDEYVNKPEVPPAVKQGWGTLQGLIGRWTGTTLNAPAGEAPPAPAAGNQ